MHVSPLVVGLPIADRRASHTFYCRDLGFAAVGEPADDGVPEPLQLVLNDGVRVMLVPTDGFDWITGEHKVAEPGHSECVLTLDAATADGVDELLDRARRAGGEVVTEPGHQPWGYAGAFADPDGHVWMVRAGSFPG